MKRKAFASRGTNAQSLTELAAALALLVPVLLVVIDLCILGTGAALNDVVCRDAARAAASGPPSDTTLATNRDVVPGKTPYQRAIAVIERIYHSNLPVKVRDDMKIIETVRDVPPPPYQGAVDGEISVETTVDIYPPFLVGAIMGAVVGDAGVAVKSKHVVPFTYTITY
ncbi:MAG: hypothetical protein KC777_25915 [Cyanobacteria bacterium HKST-UBA02]|nr:hypothetical protein [Cyanobacteria bacterium HKST-UBA02]